jgi:hypothetical protein
MRTTIAAIITGGLLLSVAGPARCDDKADARKIIDKAMKAQGGEEKLAKWKAAAWKGKGTVHVMGNPLPYTGEWAMQWPTQMRMALDLDAGGQKLTFVQVYNNGKAWRTVMGATEELEKAFAEEVGESLYVGAVSHLVVLKDPAYTLALAGEAKVDKRPAVGVKVSSKGHRDVTLYFDNETGLLVKAETRIKDEQGQEATQETFFNDYKDIDGLKHAMKMTIKRDNMPYVEMETTEFKRAEKLDDKLFEKPG